ncbi:MAG: glycosyltransferase, partial [Psychroserpens sp.]|nr:glycosyltransferase [Psychroserpens sp.]
MSKKIRVLYTIPNFDTAGSGKSVYDLVKNMDRTQFDPEICVTRNDGNFFKEVEKLDVKIHTFSFKTKTRPWITYPLRLFRIVKFFKRYKFDIIHSWNWSSDISEPLAARLAGIPYVYTKKAMGWGNKNWIRKSNLSTKIIAVNQDIIDLYLQGMSSKVVRFPLAIDTDVYKSKAISSDISKSTYFDSDDFVIVSVANLVA